MKQPKDNRIAEQRRKKGITQQQLADALSVHWMTISKLERGKMQLTLGWIERIAGALKVSIFDLVTPEATAQEVAVAGQILNGLTVEPNTQGSNYESVVRVVDDLISDWYRISGRDFEPFFFDGDLVKITQHWKGFFETCVGRLGNVSFEDGAGVKFSVFVVVDKYRGDDRFDLRSIKGIRFENAKVTQIGTVTAMISPATTAMLKLGKK